MIISMNPYDNWKIEVSEFSHLNLGIEGNSTTLEDESDVAWLQNKIEARLNVLWDQLDENPGDKALENDAEELEEALEDLAAAREEQEAYEIREAEEFFQEQCMERCYAY
jgi:hypothetical protein